MTNTQKKELFELLITANGGVSTGIAAWAKTQYPPIPDRYVCPVCQSSHYLYPYFLHRVNAHGDSYFETLNEL